MTTNPTTWARQPLTYNNVANRIDPARLSPTARYLFNITPLPTQTNVNPLVDNNWTGPVPRKTNQYTTSVRIDHRFSDGDMSTGVSPTAPIDEDYQYPSL